MDLRGKPEFIVLRFFGYNIRQPNERAGPSIRCLYEWHNQFRVECDRRTTVPGGIHREFDPAWMEQPGCRHLHDKSRRNRVGYHRNQRTAALSGLALALIRF